MLPKLTLTLTLALGALLSTTSAKLGFGSCPEVNFVTDLNMDEFMGRWYVVKRDDAKSPMYMSRCPSMEFMNLGDGNGKLHATTYVGDETGYKQFNASLVECGQHDNSTCMVKNAKWKNKMYPFTLLATDYDNYLVYYFCYPFAYGTMNFQMVMIGSRTTSMPEGDKLEEVNNVIKEQLPEYDLDTYDSYSPELHEDWCEYHWLYDQTQ